MNPREQFTTAVADYVAARPDYPAVLLARIVERSPGSQIVDLGAGTGISSRAFARAGAQRFGSRVRVTAVEPNAAMRTAGEEDPATRAFPPGTVRFEPGDAESTGLPDCSADLVVGCQAFFWFDLDRTLPEIDRILGVGGVAAAIWNLRASTPFLDGWEAMLRTWSTTYGALRSAEQTIEEISNARVTERIAVPNTQRFTLAGLRQRAWSSSYVQHGVADAEGFDRALVRLFEEHAVGGGVDFDYECVAVVWGASPGAGQTTPP